MKQNLTWRPSVLDDPLPPEILVAGRLCPGAGAGVRVPGLPDLHAVVREVEVEHELLEAGVAQGVLGEVAGAVESEKKEDF